MLVQFCCCWILHLLTSRWYLGTTLTITNYILTWTNGWTRTLILYLGSTCSNRFFQSYCLTLQCDWSVNECSVVWVHFCSEIWNAYYNMLVNFFFPRLLLKQTFLFIFYFKFIRVQWKSESGSLHVNNASKQSHKNSKCSLFLILKMASG